jgi:glycosyltransferase involved in cell wall biosynthesis
VRVPRVTVVIPAYNAEDTLGAALDSALAQTYADFSVVVIDDGSKDGTSAVADRYGSRARCIRTENRGVSAARNRGLEEAPGELVAFLDADDLWKEEKLERQVRLFDERPGVGVVTCSSLRVDEQLQAREVRPARRYPDACEALLLRSQVLGNCSSPLVSRELAVRAGGFDPSFSQCADWDFFLRLSRETEFGIIEDPLVLYRASEGNMSGDIGLLERDTFAVLDKFFSGEVPARYIDIRRRAYSNHWIILSGSYLQAGRRGDALRCLGKAIRTDPTNVSRPLGLPARRIRRWRRAAANSEIAVP